MVLWKPINTLFIPARWEIKPIETRIWLKRTVVSRKAKWEIEANVDKEVAKDNCLAVTAKVVAAKESVETKIDSLLKIWLWLKENQNH